MIERRQAAVERLLDLRGRGCLDSNVVALAAQSLGVTDRTVWRWLAAGGYAPEPRAGWTMTAAAIEAFYQAGGRPTVAWRMYAESGERVPSETVFRDAVRRDLSPAERAYARAGEEGRRRYSVYRRWEPAYRNEIWEADHAQLDVEILPLRGRRLLRPWLTVIVDGFSRVLMGWVLSLYPSSAEVLAAIREAVVIDPERGPWGGVPQLIRFDGGRDFLAEAVSRAAAELGCTGFPTAPYQPQQKGKIERFHRTLGEGLIATLPHYTGGPRRSNGKLYAQAAPLSLPQLQTRVRDFVDHYNQHCVHSSLAGLTPATKWASSAQPLDVVDPARLQWMLLADQTRRVLKDGIHFQGEIFVAPELTRIGGTTVEIRYVPHDVRSIEVFTEDGWLCTAHPQDHLGPAEAEAVIAERRAAAREMGRRKAAATRRAKPRIAPLTATGSVQEIPPRPDRRQRLRPVDDLEADHALRMLGVGDELNTALPTSRQARR